MPLIAVPTCRELGRIAVGIAPPHRDNESDVKNTQLQGVQLFVLKIEKSFLKNYL